MLWTRTWRPTLKLKRVHHTNRAHKCGADGTTLRAGIVYTICTARGTTTPGPMHLTTHPQLTHTLAYAHSCAIRAHPHAYCACTRTWVMARARADGCERTHTRAPAHTPRARAKADFRARTCKCAVTHLHTHSTHSQHQCGFTTCIGSAAGILGPDWAAQGGHTATA